MRAVVQGGRSTERNRFIEICIVAAIVACCGATSTHAATDTGTVATSERTVPRNEPRLRASALLKADVHNVQGKSLGKVNDVLIDLGRGEARYVIVKSGGAFGVGGKLFALPLRAFGSDAKGGVVLNIDAEKLKSAPGFTREAPTGWGAYEHTLDSYFGLDQPAQTQASRNLHLASQIIGQHNVLDKNGAKVGTVVDMVLNHDNGKVEYLLMRLDRGIDAHSRLLPLPLAAFYFGHSGGPPVLDIPSARLDTDLAFDEKQWPNINDPGYQEKLGLYLGRVTQDNPRPHRRIAIALLQHAKNRRRAEAMRALVLQKQASDFADSQHPYVKEIRNEQIPQVGQRVPAQQT